MTLKRVEEQYRGLTYTWGRLDHPEETPFQVAPGVWWLRFTMLFDPLSTAPCAEARQPDLGESWVPAATH